jgi:hypothetical protein
LKLDTNTWSDFMPFTENLKLEVKRRSAFRCCMCEQFLGSVQVHHIEPQSDGGSDNFENAAPLCASCHDIFGNNRDKRKFIIQKRDWWYEICKNRYGSSALFDPDQLGQVITAVNNVTAEMSELKKILKSMTINGLPTSDKFDKVKQINEIMIDALTPETAEYVSSAVVSGSTTLFIEAKVANASANVLPPTITSRNSLNKND